MKVYVVTSRFKKLNDFTSIGVSQECYTDIDKAIEFCESRLTESERDTRNKQLKRKLIEWYEFDSKDYEYRIKELKVYLKTFSFFCFFY